MLLRDAPDQPNRPSRGSALLRLILATVVVAPALTACGGGGFKPMYAAHSGSESLSRKMAQVSVTTIPGRVGQQLRNELIFQTTGGGEAGQKRFKLDIVLKARLTSQLVDAQGDSESQIYHLDADFQLTDLQNKTIVLKGQSFGRAGFQRFQTIYANVRAKRNAENRTAQTVAVDIKGRVEAFLSR